MFIGQNLRPKIEIIFYIIVVLLIEGSIDSNEIKNKFNITTKTLYRYMTFIKVMLYDYDFYYIDVYYDYSKKQHLCHVNSKFKSENINV